MVGITLTGADERTPLDLLQGLVKQGAEIGLLYTFSPDNRRRYPRLGWIMEVAQTLGRRAAIHVCGARARVALIGGKLRYLSDFAGRFQINGTLAPQDLWAASQELIGHEIITQHTPANATLAGLVIPDHCLLVDASGGRGLVPLRWEKPDTFKLVGYAGGLSTGNLAIELPRIAVAAGGPNWWIDAETGLRSDDWFDAGKAEAVLAAFLAWRDGACAEKNDA